MALCGREKKIFRSVCIKKRRVFCGLLDSELNVEQISACALVTLFEISPCVNFTWEVLRNDDPRCLWLQKYNVAKLLACNLLKGHKIMLLHQSIFLNLFFSHFISPSSSPLQKIVSPFLLSLIDFASLLPQQLRSLCVCVYTCKEELLYK